MSTCLTFLLTTFFDNSTLTFLKSTSTYLSETTCPNNPHTITNSHLFNIALVHTKDTEINKDTYTLDNKCMSKYSAARASPRSISWKQDNISFLRLRSCCLEASSDAADSKDASCSKRPARNFRYSADQ